jgi:hypothetical protein
MSTHLCNKLLLLLVLLQQSHFSTLTMLCTLPRQHWIYLPTQPSTFNASLGTSFSKHQYSPFVLRQLRWQLLHLVHLNLTPLALYLPVCSSSSQHCYPQVVVSILLPGTTQQLRRRHSAKFATYCFQVPAEVPEDCPWTKQP